MNPSEAKTALLEASAFRHACKLFDPQKPISDDNMGFLLEIARLSPTSFGMQGVRLIVITDPALKAALKPACWNQNQIDTCSHLIALTTRTADLEPYSDWVKARFGDRGLSAEQEAAYNDKYNAFHQDLKTRIEGLFKPRVIGFFYWLFHKNRTPKELYEWGARQCYIILGNLMSAAAAIGIDSCPIESFEKNRVEEILALDTQREEVAVLCALGYRAGAQPPKLRLPLEAITEFRS
ncbi:MAG: NAD(P)H-dependent oxidoreductase [Campylobacterales bacterium]|nr:NAD(P)H-dependent oxidoreductase [Campylobacterales bacterium]